MLRSTKGKIGELLVTLDLLQRGHTIIVKNLKLGHNEIDIISKYSKKLYLFEVRLRQINQQSDITYSDTQWISNRKLFLFIKASHQIQNSLELKNTLKPYLKDYKAISRQLALVHYAQNTDSSYYKIEYVPL